MKEFLKKNFDIILVCFATILVAGIGSVFVNIGMQWFNALVKPSQWIANFVIPIVWSLIYISFAVIASILIKQKSFNKKLVILSITNGILNVFWCLIFFTFKLTFLGNIVIIINAFFGVLLLNEFAKTKKWFANILWIYPIWLFVATTLNTAVWILN